MAIASRQRARRFRRFLSTAKPSGSLHPRVLKATPEHFGIVAVDCAKARSKWMLADFYGRILIPPTPVEHTRRGFEAAITELRRAITSHDLRDVIVSIERTGSYHEPAKRAFAAAGFETRIVHPLSTKQFRLPADPGNKTDDTDLFAIHRATAAGFGLIEARLGQSETELRLLVRHRRDLVTKNSALRSQIHMELDAVLPGLSAAVGNIFEHEPAMVIARRVGSTREILDLGLNGLAQILDAEGVVYQRRCLKKILGWAEQAHQAAECPATHKRIFTDLDDERRSRLRTIQTVERDIAAYLVQTPYMLLLSFPGINVVSAAEFAGEMGPIENYPSDQAITGRAGLFPSRYQSDKVDHCDGPLVKRGNRSLRYAILLIADNLQLCNAYFRDMANRWRAEGADPRMMRVRIGKRFCRIAYQMVAGRQVFRHPSCQKRHNILEKLSRFYIEHETPIEQIQRDLQAAVMWIPVAEHSAEAVPLRAALPQASSGRRSGPRPLSAILPEVLLKLGVPIVESNLKGENDLD
jgi:transposase